MNKKQAELPVNNISKLVVDNNDNKKSEEEKLRDELRRLGIEDEFHVLDDEEAKIYEAERRGT